jgi:hypothetical protein
MTILYSEPNAFPPALQAPILSEEAGWLFQDKNRSVQIEIVQISFHMPLLTPTVGVLIFNDWSDKCCRPFLHRAN